MKICKWKRERHKMVFVSGADVRPRNVLIENLKPILWEMKLIGALPIQFLAGDVAVQFSLRSTAMPYSLVVYLVMMALLWLQVGNDIIDLMSGGESFDYSVAHMFHTLKVLPITLLPMVQWREVSGIVRYINKWEHFQALYRRIVGSTLRLNLRRQANCFSAVLVTIPLLLQMLIACVDRTQFTLSTLLGDFLSMYQVLVKSCPVVLWYLLCLALARSGRSLLAAFRNASLEAETISRYRGIWLELSTLTQELGNAFCYTAGYFILHLFLLLTVATYDLLARLFQLHSSLSDFTSIFYPAVLIFSISLHLFLVCDAASLVQRQIHVAFREMLLSIQISSARTRSIENEISTFLQTLEMSPPIISLGGYVTVNRSLLVSLVSNLMTYLVVLLQFKLSSIPENDNNTNATHKPAKMEVH